VIGLELGKRQAAGDGASHHGRQSERAALFYDTHQRLPLNVHATDHRHVGPLQVSRPQSFDIDVYQTFLPRDGQQCCDCHQPERRLCCLFAQKFERMFEAPVGNREFRVNQKSIHEPSPRKGVIAARKRRLHSDAHFNPPKQDATALEAPRLSLKSIVRLKCKSFCIKGTTYPARS
jgi:hypothetical protein